LFIVGGGAIAPFSSFKRKYSDNFFLNRYYGFISRAQTLFKSLYAPSGVASNNELHEHLEQYRRDTADRIGMDGVSIIIVYSVLASQILVKHHHPGIDVLKWDCSFATCPPIPDEHVHLMTKTGHHPWLSILHTYTYD